MKTAVRRLEASESLAATPAGITKQMRALLRRRVGSLASIYDAAGEVRLSPGDSRLERTLLQQLFGAVGRLKAWSLRLLVLPSKTMRQERRGYPLGIAGRSEHCYNSCPAP